MCVVKEQQKDRKQHVDQKWILDVTSCLIVLRTFDIADRVQKL